MTSKSPVYRVISVPIEKIRPNTYNPNSVAPPELKLLYDSIREDGYTMPVVCYYDKAEDIYVIVDGFHRYRIMLDYPDIYLREGGMLPVSVIDKPLDHRMASTIRHNRARGSHNVDLMGNIVRELHELGRSDAWISRHLGMDKDEILRLKQITGLAALFKDIDFGKSWLPAEEADAGKDEDGCERTRDAKDEDGCESTRDTKDTDGCESTRDAKDTDGCESTRDTKDTDDCENTGAAKDADGCESADTAKDADDCKNTGDAKDTDGDESTDTAENADHR